MREATEGVKSSPERSLNSGREPGSTAAAGARTARLAPRVLRIGRGGGGSGLRDAIGRHGMLIVLIAFVVVFSMLSPGRFFTTATLHSIIATQAVLLLIALALTVPLRVGEFDISIGSVAGFTMALVTVLTAEQGVPWVTAVGLTVLAGIGVGLINALLVVRLEVDAFIATLGTGTVMGGLALAITDGATIGGVPGQISNLAREKVLGLPAIAYYGFALAIILWYIYEYTPLGRKLLVVGQGREAARLTGIPVGRIRAGAFVASASICGLAGVLYAGQLGAAEPTVGASFLLPAFAAAFLGGTTIKPGTFNSWGTVVALYVLAAGITGLQLLGAAFWVEPIFNGVALTLAVTFAGLVARSRSA